MNIYLMNTTTELKSKLESTSRSPLFHHLRDRMPDRYPRLLNLLLRQPCRDAYLQRWLGLVACPFAVARPGHPFASRDEHAVCKRLK